MTDTIIRLQSTRRKVSSFEPIPIYCGSRSADDLRMCRDNRLLQGPAVFPTGHNPFNLQGYYYFLIRVLPAIIKKAPDFLLTVTGYCSEDIVRGGQGVQLAGFVPKYQDLLHRSAFMLCPVFGGTGHHQGAGRHGAWVAGSCFKACSTHTC